MKIFRKQVLNNLEEISFLNCPIIQVSRIKGNIEYVDIFPHSILKKQRERYHAILEKYTYDSIYIVWNHLGESWQFLSLARTYFKKNASKKPIIISNKVYLRDLVRMLLPEVPYIYCPLITSDRDYIEDNYKEIFGRDTYTVFPIAHFYKLEDDIQKGHNVHFVDAIKNTLGLNSSNIEITCPSISDSSRSSMLQKISSIGLNIKNFVFISPEAFSNRTPSEEFWTEIENDLKNLGYDVYFNIVGMENNTISKNNRKCCDLSIEEALALMEYSKALIALRSGFVEILATAKKPVFCIYTSFLHRGNLPPMSADRVLKGFSLKNCLNVDEDNIYEYTTDEKSELDLRKEIMYDFRNGQKI